MKREQYILSRYILFLFIALNNYHIIDNDGEVYKRKAK